MTTEIIPPPANCDCGKPGWLNLIKVQHKTNGRFFVGAFGEFSEAKRGKRELMADYEYVEWIVQCPGCFYAKQQPDFYKPEGHPEIKVV